MCKVSISKGNTKMGEIASVSLPAIITCVMCDCHKKCYAERMSKRWKNVKAAYERNWDVLNNDPDIYWREVESAIMMSRFFRFHVSGDIPNKEYFANMVDVAVRNPHCEILCFTKKHDIVNLFVKTGGQIPENLHMVFSGWPGLEMKNEFGFPEAHVRFKKSESYIPKNAKECGGNCFDCATTNEGCWTLKKGESVVFNEH